MSLGSIAHLQYYFARTGLLDGKGGQLAKSRKKGDNGHPTLLLTQQTQYGGDLIESPIEELPDPGESWEEQEPIMLPPTVSTYSHRTHYIPPPPDMKTLKKELQEALQQAEQALEPTQQPVDAVRGRRNESAIGGLDGTSELAENSTTRTSDASSESQGWYELQGMHILDVTTLAIRAARIYYTSHENHERLAMIKSERKIRQELLAVLDVLKGWAGRNFAGGLRQDERDAIKGWVLGVGNMLRDESKLEEQEREEREKWKWTEEDWSGREQEREWTFLASLRKGSEPPPTWTPAQKADALPTPFLQSVRDGRDLVRFHNEAVKQSKRHFGEIKTFHNDIAKPYRCADNIRYWIKAAELRWEIRLDVDVMGVVYGSNDNAWKKLDIALMKWCKGVREELGRDSTGQPSQGSSTSIRLDNLPGGMI